jgi:predicted outer membrane repeat protein
MKYQNFVYLCLGALVVIAGSLYIPRTSAAPLFETTFFVTNAEDAGPGSLRQAILDANASPGADVIIIQVNGTVFLEAPLPIVTEDVRIEADGYTFAIDGVSQHRIFEVPVGVFLDIYGLELVSGTGNLGDGGAVWNAGTLAVQDCTFLANFAELGGAIYNEGTVHLGPGTGILQSNAVQGAGIYNLGVLHVEGTNFHGNVALLEGGAIYNQGTVTILGSEFRDGFGMDGAGIFSLGGSVTVEGSTFSSLEANHTGGAISTSGDLVLHGVSLVENQSLQGGAIYVGVDGIAEIEGTSLEQNNGETGGAVMNAGSLVITGSALTGNRAEGHGGGVTNLGTLVLDGTSLTGNTAVGDGGGLHNGVAGHMTLVSVSAMENEARAGGALNNLGVVHADASTFDNNHADWGGAIQNSGTLELQAGQVHVNWSDAEGGGLYNTGSLLMIDVSVTGNHASDGGGMLNQGEVELQGGHFEHNVAFLDFAGAIFNLQQGQLLINGTTFAHNSVINGGGAIFSYGVMTIRQASFSANGAKWGGAIYYWNTQTAVIEATSFTNNYAGHWGGAILNSGNLELEDCTFTDNQGIDFSGALHNSGDVIGRGITFSGNTTNYGSGGAVENLMTASFEQSVFENNRAYTNGGAISSVRQESVLTLSEVTLSQNEATDGGAVYNSGSLHLDGVTLTNNKTSHYGGAIYNTGSLEALNSHFIENGGVDPRTDQGGAVYNSTDASVSFSNTYFEGNFAWYNGGAIASYGPLVVTHSQFINNSALDMGGAIFQIGGIASLQDINFWGNETWNYAGTLYTNSQMEIQRCLIANSYSWFGGAIMSGGTLGIENSTISNNMANEGSAILNYGTTSLSYSTIFGNSIDGNEVGGALHNYGSLSMANSIITGTAYGVNCFGDVALNGPNLSDDDSCPGFAVGDPLLGSLQDNGGPTFTHALLWGSPALDAASGECLPTDQRGALRPQGLACDLGAYEAAQSLVGLDIRPNTNNNVINLKSSGTVPVAVLSEPGFSAPTLVDWTTLLFGATGWENSPVTRSPGGKLLCNARDVNGDGMADLVCTFPLPGTNFTCDSVQGVLRGKLQNGDWFVGFDLINPTPCP